MFPIGYHVISRLESDRLLHSSDGQRRGLVRAIYRTTAPWQVPAFGCAGVHLHLVAGTDFQGAGELGRRLEISLQRTRRFGGPFQRVYRKELADQHHAFSASMYAMRQREHHQLAADPFLEATSAPDLLGARIFGARLIPVTRELLPELRRRQLLDLYGIEDLRPAESWDDPLELIEATAAACALAGLEGTSQEVQRARACVVSLAGEELNEGTLAALLGVSVRTVRRLRTLPRDPALERTIRLQLDLRRRVRQRREGLLDAA
jgi:hypothetical protein